MKSKLDIKMLKDNKEIFSELKNDNYLSDNNNSDEKNEKDDNFNIKKAVNEYNQLSEKKLPIRVFSANFKNKFSPIQKNFYKNNNNINKKSRNIISSF